MNSHCDNDGRVIVVDVIPDDGGYCGSMARTDTSNGHAFDWLCRWDDNAAWDDSRQILDTTEVVVSTQGMAPCGACEPSVLLLGFVRDQKPVLLCEIERRDDSNAHAIDAISMWDDNATWDDARQMLDSIDVSVYERPTRFGYPYNTAMATADNALFITQDGVAFGFS